MKDNSQEDYIHIVKAHNQALKAVLFADAFSIKGKGSQYAKSTSEHTWHAWAEVLHKPVPSQETKSLVVKILEQREEYNYANHFKHQM